MKKKLKLIYNPFSGNKSFKFDLDVCVNEFQKSGYEVHLFRTMTPGDIETHISNMDGNYDAIIASGGDGTLNLVINAMMNRGLNIPIGILPTGTANDFATLLGFKADDNPEDWCKKIGMHNIVETDICKANETYFVNVCGGGLLTNVSQKIDKDFKNTLGKLAYYIKGIEQLPNFKPIPLRITTKTQVIEEELFFYLALNGKGAGGFDKLAPDATTDDGFVDFVGIKARPAHELAILFLKILRGEHINDDNVIYLRDNDIYIECLSDDMLDISETNVDGEAGPLMPITIKVFPKALSFFVV